MPDNLARIDKSHSLAADYQRVWSNAMYRPYAPGLHYIEAAIEALRPPMGASFIDFGCGTGKPAAELRKRGYGVVGVDFAHNCLDEGIDIPLLIADLTKPLNLSAEYGFCTDVMEHVEPETVDDVLMNISGAVRKGIVFSIALHEDDFGPMLIGKPLHLTIQTAQWWKNTLEIFWPRVEVLSESRTLMSVACFTSAPHYREDVKVEALCNTPDEVIEENIKVNSRRGLPLSPWMPMDSEGLAEPAVIVGGGPSLAKTLPFVRGFADAGCKIFALNNAANYLKENGIEADWQIIIDSRPENVKFVKDFPAKGYILSAQCHPALFDYLAGKNVMIFYPAIEGIYDLMPKELEVAPLVGGMITSGLQAMSVLFMAGYRTMHLHGYDSSDADTGESHAYTQDETRAELKRLDTLFNGKKYRCSFAMYKQADEFEKFSRMLADHGAVIQVYGDGLLPDIARDIAKRQAEAEASQLVTSALSILEQAKDFDGI